MVKKLIIEKSIFPTSKAPPVPFFGFLTGREITVQKNVFFYCNRNFTPLKKKQKTEQVVASTRGKDRFFDFNVID